MPRGPAPQWKKRMEPIMDDRVRLSISMAGGKPGPDGRYATLVHPDCPTRDYANEIRKAYQRSRNYVRDHEDKVGVWAVIVKADDGTYQVHFAACNKVLAKAYMFRTYGDDVSKWPYDPREKVNK